MNCKAVQSCFSVLARPHYAIERRWACAYVCMFMCLPPLTPTRWCSLALAHWFGVKTMWLLSPLCRTPRGNLANALAINCNIWAISIWLRFIWPQNRSATPPFAPPRGLSSVSMWLTGEQVGKLSSRPVCRHDLRSEGEWLEWMKVDCVGGVPLSLVPLALCRC